MDECKEILKSILYEIRMTNLILQGFNSKKQEQEQNKEAMAESLKVLTKNLPDEYKEALNNMMGVTKNG